MNIKFLEFITRAPFKAGGEIRYAKQNSEAREIPGSSGCESVNHGDWRAKSGVWAAGCGLWASSRESITVSLSHLLPLEMFLPRRVGRMMKDSSASEQEWNYFSLKQQQLSCSHEITIKSQTYNFPRITVPFSSFLWKQIHSWICASAECLMPIN